MTQFKDDHMEYIESDIKKIQMKTGMYISYVGEKGALHLAKETIQNSIDEAENPNSPCKNIKVTLDILEDSITVEDDGRGIPEDSFPLDVICTKLQSGSKFTREQGGKSAGENGVGLTATNSLSSHFSLASYRNGTMHRIEFSEGEKVSDVTEKSKKQHGTITKFSPSKKYLGKSTKIPKKGLINWVDSISYFIPDDCKITLDIYKGLEKIESYKFKSRPISDLLKSKVETELLSPLISLNGNEKMEEEVRDNNGKSKKVKRDLEIEFALVYTNALEPYVDSYCNYINTISGGVHLDAIREAVWRFFMKKTLENMTDKEKEKYHIFKVDIEQGLNIVVNLFTDMQMQLVGQTKNAVGNDDLYDPIKKLASIQLDDYFSKNKEKLTTFVKIVKANCKARVDAAKLKGATLRESIGSKMDEHKIEKFTACNNSGKAYKELHLCEGDSALNCLVDGRDPDTQAFLGFRGVTANAFKRDVSTILENAEWKRYVIVLGTNFGPKFDSSKCKYDKIIIETDSDIDGYGITSGIGAFHALYMPELVLAGKLYKAIAPLYHIDDKKIPFVRDKREYVAIYQNKIISNFKIIFVSFRDDGLISKSEFEEFIYDTQEYSEELIRYANHFGVNKFLVERVIAYLSMHNLENNDMDELFELQNFTRDFIEMIQKKYPEITLKGKHDLRGIIDGRFQSININNRFIKKVRELCPIYKKYGYSLLVKEKDSDYKEMSIGEFLDNANKFRPRIITRYKGLGEMNSKQLWDTTLNPDTRILIQLTMDDVERDLEVFRKLHGQTKEDVENRKKMMSEYKIKRDDLDN